MIKIIIIIISLFQEETLFDKTTSMFLNIEPTTTNHGHINHRSVNKLN